MDRYLKSAEASKFLGISSSSLWELKSTKVLEAGKHWIYVTGKHPEAMFYLISIK